MVATSATIAGTKTVGQPTSQPMARAVNKPSAKPGVNRASKPAANAAKVAAGEVDVHQPVAARFRWVERREWWAWSSSIAVTLLVTGGLGWLVLARTWSSADSFLGISIPQAAGGLVALLVVFHLYSAWQHFQIHRIRREISEREEVFRLISNYAADLIAVVDMEGRRIYNSLAYEKVLGYTQEELQGSASLDQVHPLDRERVKRAAEQARATGVGATLEYRMRHKDGSWRVLESTSSVIKDAKGAAEKLIIVNRDITERKRASEALRVIESGFRSVIENAPYGIYVADEAGHLLRVNPALQKMLGYDSQAELEKLTLARDVYTDSSLHRRIFETAAAQKSFKDLEVEWKRKDGRIARARCSGLLVREPDEGKTYIEVFAEDVTETRSLERQLQVAQKMEAVGRLSGGIAHDFNNLLSVIIGYSQVLKKRLDETNPLREHAEEIEKAGQRAAALTRQLLAFSRQQVLSPAPLSLNALITDLGKMIPRLIGEDIELLLQLDPAIGSVVADPGQIEQVVMNLVVNARDAMPNGGKLSIETANVILDETFTNHHPGSRAGRYVVLAVTDTGTGMSPQTLAHIFEPFFTTKEAGKGTGLGLATVYGVVKQSGGYIWVDSEVGRGSSFRTYLPQVEKTARTETAAPAREKSFRGNETVLLVEDSDALRKLAGSLLEQNGYHVLSAASGAEALVLSGKMAGRIHLLLTDVIMPGMNGKVLADHLAPLRAGLKVLFMSGYTRSAIADHGALESSTQLLQKPFSEEALLGKVREVLDTDDAIRTEGHEPAGLVGRETAKAI
jgi:two-component system cell cycle sensor histidine kinase/response regulator CckA